MHKKSDFNSLFWSIYGVNNRVFEVFDVFKKQRDKQSDEKKYDNFLKNSNILSNEIYFKFLFKEIAIFDELFIDYLLGNNDKNKFYVNQIHNITLNYKLFSEEKIDENILINIFTFQISHIIEYMVFNNISVSNFEKCLEKKSLMPFIDLCKESTKSKSLKDLSTKLSYKNSEMKERLEKNKIYIEEIHANTFQKDLSKWKNNKSLPSFFKVLIIINTIYKGDNEQKTGQFLQLIIIRSLLHIQKTFSIKKSAQIKFFQQLKHFRAIIKENYSENTFSNILEEQSHYLIDFSEVLDEQFSSKKIDIVKYLEDLKNKIDKFNQYNEGNKLVDIQMPYKDFIINEFNKCKTKNDYFKLSNEISLFTKNEVYPEFINQAYIMIQFIISIKINDKKLFRKHFKLLDRSFGLLLSLYKIEKKLSAYSKLFEDISDLKECLSLILNYFNKYQL
jgi:hypothetical protein